jgi:hypothetical protein
VSDHYRPASVPGRKTKRGGVHRKPNRFGDGEAPKFRLKFNFAVLDYLPQPLGDGLDIFGARGGDPAAKIGVFTADAVFSGRQAALRRKLPPCAINEEDRPRFVQNRDARSRSVDEILQKIRCRRVLISRSRESLRTAPLLLRPFRMSRLNKSALLGFVFERGNFLYSF